VKYKKLLRQRRNVIGLLAAASAVLLVGCGGSSDSGTGQDTSASAGNYSGSVNRIVVDGRPVPVSGGASQVFGSLNGKGDLTLFDGSGWRRSFRIQGNRFSKQTNNVGQEVAGQFCGGPEFVSGTLSGTTITGRIENRLRCEGLGPETVLVANFRIDRRGTTVARSGGGNGRSLLTAAADSLRTVVR